VFSEVKTVSQDFCVPGCRGNFDKYARFLKNSYPLIKKPICAALNFGYRWEVGHIISSTAYKAGSTAELHNAKIGVHFGLRGVNITLYATGKAR
jgi:hypothetical protein